MTARAMRTARSIVEREADPVLLGLAEQTSREAGYDGKPSESYRDQQKRLDLIVKWAGRTASANRLAAMLELARPRLAATPSMFDADLGILNTPSGIVELASGRLLPHDPARRCSSITTYPYHPDANAPRWDAFLELIFRSNTELIRYIQRLVGLCVCGNQGERILPILHGSGGNGKTTLVETLTLVLGDYAKAGNAEALLFPRRDSGPDEDMADLCGRRVVMLAEPPDSQLNTSRVKRLTGGDRISTHRKYGRLFEFNPTHTFILATNTRPGVPEQTPAIWDRLRLIPFDHAIPDEERLSPTEVREMFDAEGAGILAWCVRGAITYLRGGLGVEPEIVRLNTRAYRQDEDMLGQFIEDRCEQVDGAWTATADLHDAHIAWSDQNRHRPITSRTLGKRLAERGYEPARTESQRGFRGLRLRPGPGTAGGTR